jgi:hypothetical protein
VFYNIINANNYIFIETVLCIYNNAIEYIPAVII